MWFSSLFNKGALRNRIVICLIAIMAMSFSAALFNNPNHMGYNWTFPYFSGAANHQRLFEWLISPEDFYEARSAENYHTYKHQPTEHTVANSVNNYGYVLVALAATSLLPWLGDLQAAIVLQSIVHMVVCLVIVLFVLRTQIQRYGFIFLYAANPVIIYFATFPFYYFWMFIPSFVLIFLWFRPRARSVGLLVSTPLLLFSLLIRPTTLFLCGLSYAFVWNQAKSMKNRVVVILSFLGFGLGVFLIATMSSESPWHPAYVGLGAYQNDVGIDVFSDEEGYRYFFEQTGELVDTTAITGNYSNDEFRAYYSDVLRTRYLQILREQPLLVFRNALINILQTFGLGHDVNHLWVTVMSTLIGILVLSLLIFARQYLWILGVLSSAAGFVLYFPPIAAYHFAGYSLLVIGFLLGVERLLIYQRLRNVTSETLGQPTVTSDQRITKK